MTHDCNGLKILFVIKHNFLLLIIKKYLYMIEMHWYKYHILKQ